MQHCVVAQGKALEEQGRRLRDVTRIGVDGTSGSMVFTDATLAPVTRALMYNSSGFVSEAAHIATHAPAVHIAKGANSGLARALRLQAEAQQQGSGTIHLHHQADFIVAKLRGIGGVSDHNNALKLGYDPETDRYPAWFEAVNIALSSLPNVVASGTPLGPLSADVASALGFAEDVMVHAGTTDSIAAFLAAAPLEAGAAVTSLGTTLAVKILVSKRIDDPEIGLYSHKVGGIWLAGGASNTGGGVLAHVFDPDQIEALSHRIDATMASPLDYYPLTAPGERFPVNDPGIQPRMSPRPSDDTAYLHGLLESIARIEAQCYEAIIERGGDRPTQLFTAGGGAANAAWTQIRSRVMDISIKQPREAEAAVGIAKLIAMNAG